MKKIITFMLTVTFVFSFSWQLNAGKEDKGEILIPGPKTPGITLLKNLSPGEMQEKRERYLRARAQMRELHTRYASRLERVEATASDEVNIVLDSSYVCWHEDHEGNLYMTGMCHNEGTTPAVYVEVEGNFYDSNQTYLGRDWNYVFGGSNVRVQTEEGEEDAALCPSALGPGEYGFFCFWPGISYSEASDYSVSFTPSYTGSLPAPNALLTFDGDVYYNDLNGNFDIYGKVKNPSSTYLTIYSYVFFALFNSDNTKVLDVGSACIGASSCEGWYECMVVTYPLESKPFDISCMFACSDQISGAYLPGFFWGEASLSKIEDVDREPPFGAFETPVHGSTVCSSIPVTGWALDDVGVESVKIYRQQGDDLVYIGDVTFVEGARPDIADMNYYYPNNHRAGWGYMLLTNLLPNSGNGIFVLHAIARDIWGKTTTLGTKTIYCDNANACKPFGAIDTPTPCGEASGNNYRNVGWVLTPLPNKVPEDGSTIHVYVDGVKLGGHATYNIYRPDIAALFPGCANSGGAQAYYNIDTTSYANGMHQVFWIAVDNAGNTDGIGSRYFNIRNSLGSLHRGSPTNSVGTPAAHLQFFEINALPRMWEPVRVKKGYREDAQTQTVTPDEKGINRIKIKQLERIVIHVFDQTPDTNTDTTQHQASYEGWSVKGHRMGPLPVGSTLDRQKGIFYWQPGPGFLGCYHLVFVKITQSGTMRKKTITVEIVPETNKW